MPQQHAHRDRAEERRGGERVRAEEPFRPGRARDHPAVRRGGEQRRDRRGDEQSAGGAAAAPHEERRKIGHDQGHGGEGQKEGARRRAPSRDAIGRRDTKEQEGQKGVQDEEETPQLPERSEQQRRKNARSGAGEETDGDGAHTFSP